MAVFRYSVTVKEREDHHESGTVLARDEDDAKEKLQRLYDVREVRLRRVGGISGLLKSLTADVR